MTHVQLLHSWRLSSAKGKFSSRPLFEKCWLQLFLSPNFRRVKRNTSVGCRWISVWNQGWRSGERVYSGKVWGCTRSHRIRNGYQNSFVHRDEGCAQIHLEEQPFRRELKGCSGDLVRALSPSTPIPSHSSCCYFRNSCNSDQDYGMWAHTITNYYL